MAQSTPPQNPVEATRTYAGGVDSSGASPQDIADDQILHLVNGTVRSGFVDPRPGFRYYDPVDYVSELGTGLCQGIAYFRAGGYFVVAVDGHLYRFNPGDKLEAITDVGGAAPFSRIATRIAMVEHTGRLVCSDGTNPVVLVGGSGFRIADRDAGELFAFTVAASGWNRLWFARGRRIYYTRHEYASLTGLTPFSIDPDSLTLTTTTYIEVPAAAGNIVAMEFLPMPQTDTGEGPLVVFCEEATMTYNLSVPPADWGSQDVAAMTLPTIGCASPDAVIPRPADLMFIDQHGRVRSFQSAIQDDSTPKLVLADRPVASYSDGESPRLRKHRFGFWFDNRSFFSVRPFEEWSDDRTRVASSGLVVAEEDVVARRMRGPTVWAGLWTGPRPVAAASSPDVCMLVSRDPDGKNRIYSIDGGSRKDRLRTGGKQIEVAVVPRPLEFGLPYLSKTLSAASLRLSDLRGSVELEGWWSSDDAPPVRWFRHFDRADVSLDPTRDPVEAMSQDRPRINLPEIPTVHRDGHKPVQHFYRGVALFFLRGDARFEDIVFMSSPPRPTPTRSNINTTPPQTAVRLAHHRINLFRYNFSNT